MQDIVISLDHAQLSGLFPGFIELDCQMKMLRLGPSILKRMPESGLGAHVSDFFAFEDCVDDRAASDRIAGLMPLKLTCRSTGLKLSGPALRCAAGYLLALQVAAEQLLGDSSDLEMSDFAPNDAAIHGLLLHGLQKALLEEQRSVSIELANKQRESANLLKRISRVSGYTAHEFNNLISSIRLHCDVLERELGEIETKSKIFKMIKSVSIRSHSITKSLMTLSQDFENRSSCICVDSLILQNLQLIKTIVGDGADLRVDLNSSEGCIFANEVAFINAMVDIFINLRDFIDNFGRVQINTRLEYVKNHSREVFDFEKSELLIIEIIDQSLLGINKPAGMAGEVSSRVASARSFHFPSVLEFARGVGGDATFTSNPGQGVTVRLSLPLSAGTALAVEEQADRMAGHGCRPIGARLLLVDDERYALEALQELLEVEGYRVTACNSAAEALDALAGHAFDALLSDIIMPGMSGTVLARRAQGRDPNLAVVLMSGYVPEGEELDDAWLFVRKPIIAPQLMAALENCLANRAALQPIDPVGEIR